MSQGESWFWSEIRKYNMYRKQKIIMGMFEHNFRNWAIGFGIHRKRKTTICDVFLKSHIYCIVDEYNKVQRGEKVRKVLQNNHPQSMHYWATSLDFDLRKFDEDPSIADGGNAGINYSKKSIWIEEFNHGGGELFILREKKNSEKIFSYFYNKRTKQHRLDFQTIN